MLKNPSTLKLPFFFFTSVLLDVIQPDVVVLLPDDVSVLTADVSLPTDGDTFVEVVVDIVWANVSVVTVVGEFVTKVRSVVVTVFCVGKVSRKM